MRLSPDFRAKDEILELEETGHMHDLPQTNIWYEFLLIYKLRFILG